MHPLAIPLLFALAAPAAAQEWPQWRGPLRDGSAAALAGRTGWPPSLTPVWKVPVGAGYSGPVVSGQRVFQFSRVGEQETLRALDLATGKPLWRQSYAAPFSVHPAAYAHGPGPKGTPAVADGRVFTFGITGILSAHDAATGRLLWRRDFAKDYPNAFPTYGATQSPLVEGGRVIVHVGGPGRGALTAFDAQTGAIAWAWNGDGPAYASPVAADFGGVRQVVALTEGNLVGVAADSGRLLWKMPFTTDYDQNAVTPLPVGGLLVYSGLDHPVAAVRVERKGDAWSATPVWENADAAAYMSSPVAAGGRVCGLSHRRKGQLYCLDSATGRTAWLSEGRQGDNAALVAVGATLLVLTSEGELSVIDAAGAAPRTLRRWTVASTPTWAHPAVVPAGVLVKDQESLAFLRF